MVRNSFLRWIVIGMFMSAAFINLATIRKKDDPIVKTQTDPIAYKTKVEELKEGPKGAPAPTWKLYERPGFLNEPPVQSPAAEAQKTLGDRIPALGDPIPEDLTGIEDVDTVAVDKEAVLKGETAGGKEDGIKEGEEDEEEDWWAEEDSPNFENEVKK